MAGLNGGAWLDIDGRTATVGYARNAYFDGWRLTELASALAVSAAMAAHAVLDARCGDRPFRWAGFQ